VHPGGRIFMIDSRLAQTSTAKDRPIAEHDEPYQIRKLNDGREFKIVKVFYERQSLQDKLAEAGFQADVKVTENYFIYAIGTKR
jgi:demethylmenaquinone methyltransferase/2-methoxy-6-polyprenyl-1,4-benzoquinol methylase